LKSELNQVKSNLSDTEKEGKKVGSSLTKSFTNVGKAIAAAFSVNVLIQFARKSIELYDIQAKAETQLLQALKGREDIQKRLILQAQELQKITLFGDEATIQAQAMLAKFGMTEAQIKRLIPLIQDYATISGQDLVSAADMVARSVGTSTNALTRYGIEINGAVGSAERLESAISSLNEMVGGQAQAAAKAGIGELQQLQNAWGDFAERVGEFIYPAITKLLNAGTKLVDILKLGGLGGILNLPDAWDDATIAADKYNREQEKFIEYYEKNKGIFGSLEEAGKAYGEFLDEQITLINSQVGANGELSKSQEIEIGVLNIAKEALSDYIEEMGVSLKVTDNLTKSNGELGNSFKVDKKELESFILELKDLNSVMTQTLLLNGLSAEKLAQIFINYEKNLQRIKGTTAKYVDTTQEAVDWTEAWFDISRSAFSGIGELSDQQTEKYISNLQAQLDAGTISQEEFEKLRRESLTKEAKQNKAFAMFNIILNTSQAIIRFLADGNIPASVAAGVAGALQLITASAAPIPAFAEGVVDLKGAGTETSDSIFARLSKGESVITAKGTRQDKALFEAANKLMLEDYIHANYVLPALKDKQNSDKAMFDDYRLYLSLQNMKINDSKNAEKIVHAIKTSNYNQRRAWA